MRCFGQRSWFVRDVRGAARYVDTRYACELAWGRGAAAGAWVAVGVYRWLLGGLGGRGRAVGGWLWTAVEGAPTWVWAGRCVARSAAARHAWLPRTRVGLALRGTAVPPLWLHDSIGTLRSGLAAERRYCGGEIARTIANRAPTWWKAANRGWRLRRTRWATAASISRPAL